MNTDIASPLWSRILLIGGGVAMLLGAIDPLEGSLLIAPGAVAWAAGTWLGVPEIRRHVGIRLIAMLLMLVGVGALWGSSAVGGFGGETGRSMWWALAIVLPYFGGWLLALWGPGSPRWMHWGALVVGAWYVAIAVIMARSPRGMPEVLYFIGTLGAAIIAGCLIRLWRPSPRPATA